MSDTPRSDKAAFRVPIWDDLCVIEGLTEIVSLAVARNLERENAALREALQQLLTRYTELVNSGDCGNWNPEKEMEVRDARAALAARAEAQKGE